MVQTETIARDRGGRDARRAKRTAPSFAMVPGLTRGLPACEPLDGDQVRRIDDASLAILEEVGVVFRDPIALADWTRAGPRCGASASISTAGWCAS